MSLAAPVSISDELIRLENVTKRFGGVTALNDVSFGIAAGEVHAVLGENGAGKSSLMKLLAGVYPQDAGRIFLRGKPVTLASPLEARRQGISIVFQELNLFPHRSVAANIFANRELRGPLGLLDHRAMLKQARETLVLMGVGIDPGARVIDLSLGEKQFVEIARPLQQKSRIVILDEPNSALSEKESERLFEIVRRLRSQGITILYVSHRLEEVFALADRITVMRDGRYQGTCRTAETSMQEIIRAIVGRQMDDPFPPRRPLDAQAPTVLRVRDLRKGDRLGPISFEVRAGEILGFAGLEGAGAEDLFGVLFGLDRMTGGEVTCHDQPQRARSPLEAIRRGWGMIPASRRDQGLMMDWDVRQNTTLLVLDKLLNRLGLIDGVRSRSLARDYVRRLNIATDRLDKAVVNLSGGNQQKVLLAKWLATGPKILILNDPTRGVDIGAKREIYALCEQLAREGLAILFSSSEAEETLGLCDRVMVLYNGKIQREFARGAVSKAELMHWIATRA